VDTDILAEKVQEMLDAEAKDEKVVRRRIKVHKDLWMRFGDEADRLHLTEGQFLELLITTSGTTYKDKQIVELRETLTKMQKTIDFYRDTMKQHGIDISQF
jgi:hypothetical protein